MVAEVLVVGAQEVVGAVRVPQEVVATTAAVPQEVLAAFVVPREVVGSGGTGSSATGGGGCSGTTTGDGGSRGTGRSATGTTGRATGKPVSSEVIHVSNSVLRACRVQMLPFPKVFKNDFVRCDCTISCITPLGDT